jgi:membrane associated rhomboid family serine protease
MGLFNRHYWRNGGTARWGGGMLPRPSSAVKWLLIINLGVFVAQIFADRQNQMTSLLGVTVNAWWQIWRYATFQFLHADAWHIALNMLGLYLLGTPLEREWGPRKFLWFYLSCGVFAGVLYAAIGAATSLPGDLPIIGASGGVYGILLAAAVLMPHFRILFLFFPVPIRLAAVIIFGVMILQVLGAVAGGTAYRVMSDVAHLGGAIMAAFWLWKQSILDRFNIDTTRPSRGRWQRKLRKDQKMQEEVDRILQKVHRDGLASLSSSEKRFLQKATRIQQQQGRRFDNM